MSDLSEEELQELYAWIDEIPLTRQKKNITRDFSDGVLTAEVVHNFLPKYVDLHNYSPANANQQKIENWRTLNRKVFSRLNFGVPEDLLQGAATGKQGVIEFILYTLRSKIEHHLQVKVAKDYTNDELFAPPHLDIYQPDHMVTAYQPSLHSPSLWDGRHGRPAMPDTDTQQNALSRTYPAGVPTVKNPLLPSRIPVSSKKVSGSRELNNSLRQDSKPLLPPIERRAYSLTSKTVPSGSKKRENSAKYKLRLAEKDQKILETHEYIQFLQMKVTRFEHLVQIKDMKIEELKKELETVKTNGRQTYLHHPVFHRR